MIYLKLTLALAATVPALSAPVVPDASTPSPVTTYNDTEIVRWLQANSNQLRTARLTATPSAATADDKDATIPSAATAVDNESKLLREVPMLMTHDAATGYKGLDGHFVQVQDYGFYDQLMCGARAFDLRAIWMAKDDKARYHHLPDTNMDKVPSYIMDVMVMDQSLGDNTFNNFINFANEHPDELIVLYLSHCAQRKYNSWPIPDDIRGKGCFDEEFVQTFRKHNVLHLNQMEGCQNGECLETLTFGEAKALARKHGQQGIIAITQDLAGWDPVQSNWDSEVKPGQWDRWNQYLGGYLAGSAPSNQLRNLQAHWQANGIKDSAPGDGDFNRRFHNQLTSGEIPLDKLNLVQINWFCQGGKAIAEAIGTRNLDQCNARCH